MGSGMPLSLGDMYLLSKMALKIGQAFTKGRKSAPAEFREIESQLYSLSAALSALTAARESTTTNAFSVGSAAGQNGASGTSTDRASEDVLVVMLRSCKETLGHLEGVVDKYSVLGGEASSNDPQLRRWSREIKLNWKKVLWTTEGGDLATLKSNLTVHTNSLNLVLGVLVNSQTDRLQTDMTHLTTMIGEIHTWFKNNIQDSNQTANAPNGTTTTYDISGASSVRDYFELYEQSGDDSTLLCRRASLSQDMSGTYYNWTLTDRPLFSCHCGRGEEDTANHRSKIDSYYLSPLSFALRIAGSSKSWLIYKVANRSTGQMASLVVKGMPLSAMHDFEELLVHGLGVVQARQMMGRGISTMLAHVSEENVDIPEVKVLDLIGNPSTVYRSIKTVKFVSGTMHYTRGEISEVQMLHYKTISLPDMLSDPIIPRSAFQRSRSAEIIVAYRHHEGDSSEDITKTLIHLRWNSEIEHKQDDATVTIKEVQCTASKSSGEALPPTTAGVSFELENTEASSRFYKDMQAIRMDLFIIHLQHAREGEQILIRFQAETVHNERMSIHDADITIFQDVNTSKCRLVVQNRNGNSIISQELSESFFRKLNVEGKADFSAPTFEVYFNSNGDRCLRQCPKGFSHLIFPDERVKQVFLISLATIAGTTEQHQLEGPGPAGIEGPSAMEGVVAE